MSVDLHIYGSNIQFRPGVIEEGVFVAIKAALRAMPERELPRSPGLSEIEATATFEELLGEFNLKALREEGQILALTGVIDSFRARDLDYLMEALHSYLQPGSWLAGSNDHAGDFLIVVEDGVTEQWLEEYALWVTCGGFEGWSQEEIDHWYVATFPEGLPFGLDQPYHEQFTLLVKWRTGRKDLLPCYPNFDWENQPL